MLVVDHEESTMHVPRPFAALAVARSPLSCAMQCIAVGAMAIGDAIGCPAIHHEHASRVKRSVTLTSKSASKLQRKSERPPHDKYAAKISRERCNRNGG